MGFLTTFKNMRFHTTLAIWDMWDFLQHYQCGISYNIINVGFLSTLSNVGFRTTISNMRFLAIFIIM